MALTGAGAADAAAPPGAPAAARRIIRLNPAALFDATPFGFTQVAVDADTRVAHLSGQTSMDTAAAVVGASLDEQLPLARAALVAALAAVGATPADILKLTTYVVDLDPVADMAAIKENGLVLGCPAATLVGVAKLALPGLRVELDATAAVSAEAVEMLRKEGRL